MEKLKKYLSFISIAIIISGCSAAAKLRRAEKLIKKAEEQGAVWKVDTVHKLVKVGYPEVMIKEVHIIPPADTLRIEKERLKIKIVKMAGDSIFVEGKCETDTVEIEVPVTVTKTIEAKGGFKWWHILLALLAGGLLVRIFWK